MRLNFSELPTPTLSRQNTSLLGHDRHHSRASTHPHLLSTRQKPRRWPLVFRFIKGAIHGAILVYVLIHAAFTAFVVCLDRYVFETVGLPNTIIPSLSIVVGLMLVFRNQTSYNRFWDGRNGITTVTTCVRNLVRTILTNAYNPKGNGTLSASEKADIERTIRILMAIPFALKNHLRAEWGAAWAQLLGSDVSENGTAVYNPVYAGLLPGDLEPHEEEGLGLPFQLTFFIDGFIKRGVERGWFHAPGASQMQAQLNSLTDAYGKMETIKLTPIPVAHLIHQKQVLALYGAVLPFAMVDDMGWWTVPMVSLLIFTLYGIEGIGSQLEDPFGYDRNDIKMDALAGDAKMEIDVVLAEWRKLMARVEAEAENEVQAGVGAGEVGVDVGVGVEKKDEGFVMPDMFLRVRVRTPRL
ncbi:Bestrophin, RFP-TM, chloride channel-domain-containing protein [Aspergillus cavernicola]|uniref:Bestrophin, RFP-TM, chloride channel-domain-containing protein n=1 Tax=Aspergillus cavernicola TaxID=176166 RepID=A0ABR4IFG2_9EURO